MALVEGERAREEGDRRAGLLVRQHFGVGQAGGVIDGDMNAVPADGLALVAIGVGAVAPVVALDAGDALASAAVDAPELFDVDVDQLARSLTLIALGRLLTEPAQATIPIRVRISDTVDAGIASNSAISRPVNRSRRSAAIASIRRSSVRLATRCGALLRSNRALSRPSR